MSGLIYDIQYTTPSGKHYEVSVFENTYGSEFAVSVYQVNKFLWFKTRERIMYREFVRGDRTVAISFAEKLATSPLITEK